MSKMDYETLTNEQLAGKSRDMDTVALFTLITRFDGIVSRIAEPFFLQGGDKDDLKQEGRLGLLYAISDYEPEKNASFETFARLCIRRQILHAVERANRKKNLPLNEALSMDGILEELENGAFATGFREDRSSPEEQLVAEETREEIQKKLLRELTQMERDVFLLMLQGYEYQTISEILNRPVKSVDNAMQRIRKKARSVLEEVK